MTAADPTVGELSEGAILRRILDRLGDSSAEVGPGDDAAVIAAPRRPRRRHDRHARAWTRLPAGMVERFRPRLEGCRGEPRRHRGDGRAAHGAARRPRDARRRRDCRSSRHSPTDSEPRATRSRPAARSRAATSPCPTPSPSRSRRSDRSTAASPCSAAARVPATSWPSPGDPGRGTRGLRIAVHTIPGCRGLPGRGRRDAARPRRSAPTSPSQLRPSPPIALGPVAAVGGGDGDDGRVGRARARRVTDGCGIRCLASPIDTAALGDDPGVRTHRRRGPRPARHVPEPWAAARRLPPDRPRRASAGTRRCSSTASRTAAVAAGTRTATGTRASGS